MSDTTDPITQIYRKVRSVLVDRYVATSLAKERNAYDFSDPKVMRVKQAIVPGDIPEIVVTQGEFTMKPFGSNSRTATVVQSFPVMTVFDTIGVEKVNQLKYQALIALLKAGDDLGLPRLVRSWDVVGARDDPFGQQEWKRGEERMMTVFTVQTHLEFDRQALLAM